MAVGVFDIGGTIQAPGLPLRGVDGGRPRADHAAMSSEIVFEVTEAIEGGYVAVALGHGITTQGDTLDDLRAMVRDAVACYFDDPATAPKLIRLHFVRDEVLAA